MARKKQPEAEVAPKPEKATEPDRAEQNSMPPVIQLDHDRIWISRLKEQAKTDRGVKRILEEWTALKAENEKLNTK
jgi:hypothetical protein